ncbi:MAG: universal stress protein [Proteobacteria bacterium]|nr:universal stress protein [Pseudomonadota bacterium]
MSSIIVCIDSTNASETALRYACYKAKDSGFTVQILAILEASYKNLPFAAKAIGNEKRQQIETRISKLIDSVCKETGITPAISIREGDITSEIIRELKNSSDCKMIVFGKSNNSLSDNTVLPKIVGKIGSKINVPITIVPENLSDDLLKSLA